MPMRSVVASLGLLALLSGCIASDGSSVLGGGVIDCSTSSEVQVASNADVLLPADVPDQAREPFGPIPRATVHAREGQKLDAVATWQAAGGEVGVLFDGPAGNVVTTDNTWTFSGMVPEGDYTLELEGDPFATQVTYTLYLVASGCTAD